MIVHSHLFSVRAVDKHDESCLLWCCEVMSFTTMNVHNVSVGSINNLQELRAQLFCQ